MPLAIELAEAFAPEHLEISTREPEAIAARITRSGAVFVGPNCATAFGDYVAGSNHVLPTGGAARHASALGPTTFLRRMSVVEMTDEAVEALTPHLAALADAEGFTMHRRSAEVRRRTSMSRTAEARRTTGETDVRARVDLDGTGTALINTGVGFFDHMLTLLARHSLIDIEIEARGDLETGSHHTVEDVGITLGQALGVALGDRAGIERYGSADHPDGRVPGPGRRRPLGPPLRGPGRAPARAGASGVSRPSCSGSSCAAWRTTPGLTLHVRTLVPGKRPPHHRGQLQGARARAGRGRRPQPARLGRAVHQGESVTPRVAVLDYEMSNLRSATKALELLGADVSGGPRAGGGGRRRRRGAAGRRQLRRGHAAHPRAPARRRRARRRGARRARAGHLPGPPAAVRRERGEPRRARPRRAARARSRRLRTDAQAARTSAGAG